MAAPLSSLPSNRIAAGLIVGGLALMMIAQVVEGLPVAAAMALVAWGAVQLANSRSNGAVLVAVNVAIYVALVGYAIASQTQSAQSQGGVVGLLTLTDHALAIVLLVGLVLHVTKSPTTTIEQ